MTLKKAILYGILGFPIGTFISVTITMLISLIRGTGEFYFVVPSLIDITNNELNAFILQFILSGVLGFAFGAGSAVFQVESWSITKQTVIHFFISTIAMFPIAYICRWMDHSLGGVVSYILTFVIAYFIAWFVQYNVWKKKIKVINSKLQNK